MFFLYGLVSWQSADPGIETYTVYCMGWGGVQTEGQTVGSRSKITQQAGEQTADFRVADRKKIKSKKRLWVKKVGGGDRCADNR